MLVLEQHKIESRQDNIIKWYEEIFPSAASFIQGRGGDLDISRDIFQEAIVCYYEKLIDGDFTPVVSDQAYFMGIVKKLWFKHCELAKPKESLDNVIVFEEKPQQLLTQKLMTYLMQSGQRCMDLLKSFYYEKLKMKEVADRFGYSSERSATVGKYKCLEKVREEIKLKSLSYEDFID